jgi:hypothetical protein
MELISSKRGYFALFQFPRNSHKEVHRVEQALQVSFLGFMFKPTYKPNPTNTNEQCTIDCHYLVLYRIFKVGMR